MIIVNNPIYRSDRILKKISLIVIFFLSFNLLSYAQEPLKEDNSIRLMSYNIRNAKGMDNTTDLSRISDVIKRVNPDFVALQEIDSATVRNGGINLLQQLASEVLMYPLFAPAIEFQGGKYGVGLLSKEKPINHTYIPLPGREESRVLLLAEFEKFYIASTHFSLNEQDRVKSAGIVSSLVKSLDKPLYLAGDLNALPDSELIRILSESFNTLNDVKQSTFPADNADRCIDFIMGPKDDSYSLLVRKVVNEPLASDHRPLYADIRIKSKASQIFKTQPYLQNPVNGGITISWMTNVPTHSWIEYGVDGKLDRKKELYVDGQIVCNTTFHKIRVEDLEPGVTYSYRVCSREISLYQAYKKEFGPVCYSNIYTFKLPDEKEDEFTAIVFNDLHKQYPLMDKFAEVIKDLDYDLVFFNGDCIDDPKNEEEAVGFLSYMNNMVNAAETPVIYMRGNHEIRNAYSIELRSLFDYIGDKTYGAFNWGDTRFVLLDCGEDKPDSTWVYYGLNDFDELRRNQAEFLKKELKSKEFKKADKRVLIHHIPIFGMRKGGFNPCLDLWGPILEKAPFNVSINGHTHRFAYHPAGSESNSFPVVIGGGNRADGATVMVLHKKGKELTLKVLSPEGEEKLVLSL